MKLNKDVNASSTSEIVQPLGNFSRDKMIHRAKKLVTELQGKSEQEKRRCKHPNHPTYYVNKNGKCKRAWKCKDKGEKGCVIR